MARAMRRAGVVGWAVAVAVAGHPAPAQVLGSNVCANCHPKISETFRRTGMARSFYRPTRENVVEDYTGQNTYYHRLSDTYFSMIERQGRYFQRQYQIGFDGKETNVTEKEVDFVLGSGNHSRAYLHRTPANTLIELPLAWYAERGGYWAMNPGYDRPDHQGFRRVIGYDCVFCHNSYPEIAAGRGGPRDTPVLSALPEGIDCQRCHGNGEKHVAIARRPGASPEDIRNAIVNPSRLSSERQMEVCMQCHLETTSFALPNSIVRYERQPFSYRPGEPLADFMLHFDRAPGRASDDNFEINSSAYRLRQSQCFQKSKGALICTTCHNPHDIPRGEQATRHYAAVCRQCHGAAFDQLVGANRHTRSEDCTGCHMPARRTEDVVHTVMTDHRIQRMKPPRNLLAEIAERRTTDATAYRGEVVLYDPRPLPTAEDELYLAIAQVSQSSNLTAGIARLSAAIEKYHPASAEYYLQLGDALCNTARFAEALPVYEEALRREPDSVPALERLALCLLPLKQYARAEGLLKRALQRAPDAAASWTQLGRVYLEEQRATDAIAAFEKAIQIDPDMVEAYNAAGAVWFEARDFARSEAALRSAIRVQPNYAQAHDNLGNLLSATGRFEEARYHFEAALRFQEDLADARFDYALALSKVQRLDEAQAQIDALLRIDAGNAEAHELLGNLLGAQGKYSRAIEHFREAVRIKPDFSRANLDLGAALVDSGDPSGALPYLRKAAAGADAAARDEARKILQKLEQVP